MTGDQIMSKYEKELRRRLALGEDNLEATATWYMKCVAADKLEWKDMSVFEVRFWKRIYTAFGRWRTLH
jgi:hypothetical protein